jgi:hypothetical protein
MKLIEARVLLTNGQKLVHTEQDTRDPFQETSNAYGCTHNLQMQQQALHLQNKLNTM